MSNPYSPMRNNPQSRSLAGTKVWVVAPATPPYGGMSVQAEKLVNALASKGISVEMIPTNPDLPRSLSFVEHIPVVRTILREVQYLNSLRRIARNPGVVHHFSASYLYFFLHSAPLLLMAKPSSAKLVLNYRGGKAEEFLRAWSWAALPLLKRADAIVVPSEFLGQVFRGFGLTSTILPNLADTELFPFVQRDRFSPRLFVSRNLEPIYDIECVLRAFQIVQTAIPEAILGIAGDGSEASRLRNLVRDRSLRGVTLYGAVPHDRLASLYRQHDIYVNASRVDNFPGALVEAACAGLPIITTEAGGIPEMIRHGENGLLCELGDAEALANNVLEVVRRPDFGRKLSQRARLWAEQFSWRNVFPRLLACYGLEADPVLAVEPEQILVH